LNKKRNDRLIKFYQDEIDNLENERDKLFNFDKKSMKKLAEKKKQLSIAEKEEIGLKPVIRKREGLLLKLREKEKWENMISVFRREIRAKKKEIKGSEKQLKNIKDDSVFLSLKDKEGGFLGTLAKKQLLLKQSLKESDKYEVMEKVFESTMRAMFDDFLEQLNYFSNYFLDLLSEGDISVSFDSKRETLSKKIIDEINVLVSVNEERERRFKTYCGGEKGRINVSTQLSLFSAAESPIALLFLDEPFVSMDDEGIDRTIDVLRGIANKGVLVMVISHEKVVKGYGAVINVIRENNRSRIE